MKPQSHFDDLYTAAYALIDDAKTRHRVVKLYKGSHGSPDPHPVVTAYERFFADRHRGVLAYVCDHVADPSVGFPRRSAQWGARVGGVAELWPVPTGLRDRDAAGGTVRLRAGRSPAVVDVAGEPRGGPGSTLGGVLDGLSISVSIGLQSGVTLETFVLKYANMRFEPMGITNDPEIRTATSILDYVFRRLAMDFLDGDTRRDLEERLKDERPLR